MIENIWLNHESRRLQRNHVAQSAQSAQLDQQFTPAIIQNIFSLCSMTANILRKICNFSFDISSTLDNKRKFSKYFRPFPSFVQQKVYIHCLRSYFIISTKQIPSGDKAIPRIHNQLVFAFLSAQHLFYMLQNC